MKEQLKLIIISLFVASLLISCDGVIYLPNVPEKTPEETPESGGQVGIIVLPYEQAFPKTTPPYLPSFIPNIGEMPYEGLPYGENTMDYQSNVPAIPDATQEETISGTYYHLPWPCIETDTDGVVMLTAESGVLKGYLEENDNFPVDVANVRIKKGEDTNGHEWAVLINGSTVTKELLPVETFKVPLREQDGWFYFHSHGLSDDPAGIVYNQDNPDIRGPLQWLRDRNGVHEYFRWLWAHEGRAGDPPEEIITSYLAWASFEARIKPEGGSDDRIYYYSITEITGYGYSRSSSSADTLRPGLPLWNQ